MRLLNVHSLELEDFTGREPPPYTILSHRWGDDEVSYKEFRKGLKKSGAGYRKIVNFCTVVRQRGMASGAPPGHRYQLCIDWAWIDTCCIDKRSSAELSEAINSMYKWYRSAYECIIHLDDVVKVRGQVDCKEQFSKSFKQSAWFRRGWTLQELLAPKTLIYYSAAWEVLGHQNRNYWDLPFNNKPLRYRNPSMFGRNLIQEVSESTGIPRDYLSGSKSLVQATIAQRMSWAANRRTTRLEDEAYCLLGIFGISMPLLYGEGRDAFFRLQQEIIARTGDLSILSWDRRGANVNIPYHILAESPKDFAAVDDSKESAHLFHQPLTVKSTGVEMRVKLSEALAPKVHFYMDSPMLYRLTLNYSKADQDLVRIVLVRTKPFRGATVYKRLLGVDFSLDAYARLQWEQREEELIQLQIRPDLVKVASELNLDI